MNAKNTLTLALRTQIRNYVVQYDRVCTTLALTPAFAGTLLALDQNPYTIGGPGVYELNRMLIDYLPPLSRTFGPYYMADFPETDFIIFMADYLNELKHITTHNVHCHDAEWCAQLILDYQREHEGLNFMALYCNACGGYNFDIFD